MVEKFHISESGVPARCNAFERPCPRGGASEHYSTPEKAEAAFALSMAAELLPPAVRAPKLRVADRVEWGSSSDVRTTNDSLNRPDTDFGYNWVSGQFGADRGIRVSLAKWDDDETGTLYASDSANDRIAILAKDVDANYADAVWHQMLAEGHPQVALEDLIYRLDEQASSWE